MSEHEMTWKFLSSGSQAFCGADGQILGEVSRGLGGGYYASAKSASIGRFIDETSAKAAVERAVREAR